VGPVARPAPVAVPSGAPQVIIIQERRARPAIGVASIAVVAAAALLASGGTYALWRSNSTFGGGQVIAGDLDLSSCAGGKLKWYDISPDRDDRTIDLTDEYFGTLVGAPIFSSDGPKSIKLRADAHGDGVKYHEMARSSYDEYPDELSYFYSETPNKEFTILAHEITDVNAWRMVPGDTVLAVCKNALISLEGDNLVAELAMMDSDGKAFNFDGSIEHLAVITDRDTYLDNQLYSLTALPSITESEGVLGYFGAPNSGQANGIEKESTDPWFVQLSAKTGETGLWDDLRTSDKDNDGRESLGQGFLSVFFIVHFVDDGIDAEVSEGDGVNDISFDDGEIDKTNSRYLAQSTLAKLADGYLVLRQVRAAGAFTAPED